MLIGIAGKKRVGKDTAAAILAKEFDMSTFAFAGKIKDMLEALGFHYSDDMKYQPCGHSSGMTPREAMRYIGMELRTPINYWIQCARAQLERTPNLIISDVRFADEAQFIHENHGIIIMINRELPLDEHTSESLHGIDADYYIDNNGTVDELKTAIINAVQLSTF